MMLVAGVWLVLGGGVLSAPAPVSSAAVVVLDDGSSTDTVMTPALGALATRFTAHLRATSVTVLSSAELVQRMTGTAIPRATVPDAVALNALLSDAAVREGYFDDAAAETLRRQVLEAFESALQPDATLRQIASEAARDLAIGAFTARDATLAVTRAREAWRRFGSVPLSPSTHSPKIHKLFEEARVAVEHLPRTTLHVLSDVKGTVYADGVAVGTSDGDLVVKLPQGAYRLWLAYGAGMSLPYTVTLTDKWAEVRIDTQLDRRLSLGNPLQLRCLDSCARDLSMLAARAGVARAYGIRAADNGAASVWVRDNDKRTSYEATFSDTLGLIPNTGHGGTYAKFSPWYLVPFGGGQFAQHRPVFGSTYLGAQAILLAWHLSARSRFNTLQRGADLLKEERTRREANLSLGLLIGAVATNVVEAVVFGRVFGVASTDDASQIATP